MDKVDQHLLHAVQRDAAQTTDKLAQTVGSSPSAVQRRLKRLKDDGIILRQVAEVDPSLVGRPLTFVVGVEIERKREDLYQRFRRWIDDTDDVQQAYNVAGGTDFILIITASSVEHYDELMDRMLAANENIKRYTTSTVLRTFKRSLFTPAG